MTRCTYCGRVIWWFQDRGLDGDGYIHNGAVRCQYKKDMEQVFQNMQMAIDLEIAKARKEAESGKE
jgi:hypothetical protein